MVKKLEGIKTNLDGVYENMTEIQAEAESNGTMTQEFLACIGTSKAVVACAYMHAWINQDIEYDNPLHDVHHG